MTKRVSLSKIALSTSAVAAILILSLLAFLAFTTNTQIFEARTPLRVVPIVTYDHQEVANPDSPIGVSSRYTWKMGPSPAHGTNIGIYTFHQYVRVYVDGVEQYRLAAAEQDQIVHTPGASWCMFPIYPQDANKEICIEIIPVYETARDREPVVFMGTVKDIFAHTAKGEIAQLVLCILTIIAGIIFLIVGLYGYLTHGKGKTLIAHGLFSIMLGIWKLTDLRTVVMLFPEQTVFLYYSSVCMLSLCAVPLIKALSRRVARLCGHLLNICCVFCASVCILQHLLQILGILDLRQMLSWTHISIFASSLVCIPALIYDGIAYRRPAKEQHNKVLVFVCGPGAILDIILFYFTGDSAPLVFTLAAHLIYTIIVGTQTLVRANRQEAEIEKSQNKVLRSQIQPHFLFNSLTAIAQLCEKDPALAKQATITFSEYYRGNLRAINHTAPITFTQELEHLKMYLFIEQLRFGDSLNVVFNIETTDFHLPPLTIQPIVENAVKHGIGGKEDGGTVTISTLDHADCVIISISDDGVGFDPNDVTPQDRQHVGLENVKNRLRLMCDAALEVQSAPGAGTTVTISVPKEGLEI